jgi:hypothetical protein
VWRTSPDSQKVSSDAAATQLLSGEYSETGIDLISTLFIFPNHSYVETVTGGTVGLWEEGSWQFDRGLIELRSTWRKVTGSKPKASIYLPMKISSDGAFGLFSWAETFAEHSADLSRFGYNLIKPITAAEIPALRKRFRHLRLLIEAGQHFTIIGSGDEEPSSGNQDMLVFKPDTNGELILGFLQGGVIGNWSVLQLVLRPRRIEIPYDLQSVRLVGPVEIQDGNQITFRISESDLIYSLKTQRITGKDIEIRIRK